MTERYEKSPAIRLGILNGTQSIPTWSGKRDSKQQEHAAFCLKSTRGARKCSISAPLPVGKKQIILLCCDRITVK